MLLRTLYTLLLTLAAPFLLHGLYRRRQGKPSVGKRWKEHFGITPPLKTATPPIWIHAASMGETLAVTPLIKQIKQRSPNTPILLTTTTRRVLNKRKNWRIGLSIVIPRLIFPLR